MTDILSEVRRGLGEIVEHGFEVKKIKLRPDVKRRLVRDHLDLLALEDDGEGEKTKWKIFNYPVDVGFMKEDFKIEFRVGMRILELGPGEVIVTSHIQAVQFMIVKKEAAE
ncbi:hypothetical protein MOD72_12030 [Bacillus haynesii]|uniref:hypothetical protein n=1 Tax=Bacillus haynesii TaxID=1925021 RepID=UPI002282680D|nr:hypothetical protein [Bacillus haynesii]MCY8609905.1 hypothetical protein [Bacillus haynesii]